MAKNSMKSLFKGKESYSEELKEAKAIKSGRITPQQYARGEKMEDMKKVKKMSSGGVARGMGAAKRGGRFVRSC